MYLNKNIVYKHLIHFMCDSIKQLMIIVIFVPVNNFIFSSKAIKVFGSIHRFMTIL